MECLLAGVRGDLKTLSVANNQIILYFSNNVWPITTYQCIYKIRLVLKMHMKIFLIYIAPTVYNKLIPCNCTIILVAAYNAQTLGGIPFVLQFPNIISQSIQHSHSLKLCSLEVIVFHYGVTLFAQETQKGQIYK